MAADPWAPWPGCETLEYRSADGAAIRFLMLVGAKARMMPPVALTMLPVPAANGSRFLGAAHLERVVSVPVAFPGSFDGRADLRQWARVLDPTRGEGTLTVVDGANPGRFLRCAYDSGLDELEEQRPDVNVGALLFRAGFPYWLDGAEQSVSISQGSAVRRWFPFLPLILGASDAYGLFTITNLGDAPAYPVLTVLGPGTDVTAKNLTTGQAWTVSGLVPDGSTLTVDTRPGRKAVRLDGANVFSRLTAPSQLWALQPGTNQVELSIAGTSAATLATLAWRQAWLAA